MTNTEIPILLVTSEFPPQPGGIGYHAYHLATFLERDGFELTVITDQRSLDGKQEATFDASCDFKIIRVKRERLIAKTYLTRIKQVIQNTSRKTIVIASGKFSLWVVAMQSQFKNCKTVAILHGTEVNFQNPILKKSIDFSIKRFDKLIAVSNFTKNLVAYLNLPITVIPNGIVFNYWNMDRANTALILKGSPILVTIGRISERKGQFKVVGYLPELIKYWPHIQYHCIGLDNEGGKLMELATTLGVCSHLTIHGPLPTNQLKDYLSKADIALMLSQNTYSGDVEGFGIAALEANALGIPVIGSKGSGLEDAIEDYKSGRLVDSSNFEEIKEAINEILKNRPVYKQNSVLWAKQHDWSKIIQQYLNVLE
ncbi:glycosyltransferase family 4 protein [Aegicerativicinus sediminis]|uniref:glycosyltransferase family 4 protein n=1 Tax=Aegicerativicinus sediminis TaxID=2893202 RepID=UPI001E35FF51|nr:glycosyltransferase family 4 protein [Aegicerativicinus sediminis]